MTMPAQEVPPARHRLPSRQRKQWPARFYLFSLMLVCLAPGLLSAIALVWRNDRSSQALLEEASIQTARALRQAVDSHLAQARVTVQVLSGPDAVRTVGTPIVQDGKAEYLMTAVLRSEIFSSVLKNQGLPADWVSSILDKEGNIVTQVTGDEKYAFGKNKTNPFIERDLTKAEGFFETVDQEGKRILGVYSRSPETGWTVILEIPQQSLESRFKKPVNWLLAGIAGVFALGIALAWWVSNRIARSIGALVEPAQRLGLGEPAGLANVQIDEAREVAQALVEASTLLRQRTEALEREREIRVTELEQKIAERTEALNAAMKASEMLARQDALTGLKNRLAANERLQEEFLRMRRTGERYSALLLDIDHFKQVNDRCGHETGDRVLKRIADMLLLNFRATDFVFRFGGEEFLILLPATPREGALIIAEKIRAAVEAHLFASAMPLTISIGVSSVLPEDAGEYDAVRRADSALYLAKNGGRNRISVA